MACRYIYKGHEFESELALDDFLLERLPFEPILGDMVFSNTLAQNLTTSKITQISKDSENARKVAKEVRRNSKQYTDDGEIIIDKPPYIGVNKFIGLYRNSENNRLIPEFLDEEYWQRRYADWKVGDYTNDEKELFNITEEKGPQISDVELQKNMRSLMEDKWRNQAKAGDAIHNVLLLFFTLDKDGKYLFEMSNEDFKLYCIDNLDKDNKDFITEPVIEKTIQYARQLHEKIKLEFGENCIFFPEFTVTLNTNTLNPDLLLGMIDLMIIDNEGVAHILDYKTSLHDYENFKSEKKLGYKYQLATYLRMLEKYGLNTGKIMIAPIQILGFRKEDRWVYDDIKSDRIYVDITDSINDNIWENIDEFMVAPLKIEVTTDLSISKVTEGMNNWFPDFSNKRLNDVTAVKDWLKKYNLLKKNNLGYYTFKRFNSNEPPIISDNEVDFVIKVADYFLKELPKLLRHTRKLRNRIKEAMEKGLDMVEFPIPFIKSGSLSWLKDTISPYCNGNWKISEQATDLLENFGIIMLETKDNKNVPPQIDFIRVSTRDLSRNYRKYTSSPFKKRKGLTGAFEPDISALSKLNNLMLEAAVGNVELMETMLVINQLKGIEKYTIGNILVVNPNFGNGLQASNEELLYCFNELDKHKSIGENRFKSGEIKLATKYDVVRLKVAHILSSGNIANWKDTYKDFENFLPATAILDREIQGPNETEDKILKLYECLDLLTGRKLSESERTLMQRSLDKTYSDQTHLKSKHIDLYNSILIAISDLKGVNYRLLLDDHYQWFSDIMKIPQEGFTGNYSDNPGNLKSETLNLVTKLVTEAYLNTRDDMQRENTKIRKLINNLKELKNFGFLTENTIGNQASLYKNMYKELPNGNIVFEDPNNLQGAEKEFLEYALYKINKDRFPNRSDAQLLLMKDNQDPEYYNIPLCVGGSDSTVSSRGLLSALRSKLEYFIPSKAWELSKRKLEGVFNSEDYSRRAKSELIYKMTNMFDVGNDQERRIDKINELKKNNIPIELNFETLLLKHIFAYSVLRNMDEVFPLIKASMIHILSQGAVQNREFDKDTKYLTEYIENKIYNKTIVNEENEHWVKQANLIKQAASLFTLALAPVQLFYQPLQGLWQDISLIIRKPDGKTSFTFKNFLKAFKLVYSELGHFSDKPTLCSAINELYGINDMDMNSYVDRISTAKKGIWNIFNFLFKFASRPDFYNRMVIFTALMIGDGCLEAHHIDKNGALVYDWKKDERFKAFANNDKSDMEKYNKAKSLYYAVAQQFVQEHVKDSDGNTFELDMNNPKPLPRAYTNKEAESMKSLGDTIFGYYSHEKKSLIMATSIGSLWLLFRTYWSGKKNLYLAHGGVKLMGNWELYEENGEKYYYQINDRGVVLYDLPPLSESEMRLKGMRLIAPVMQWKGQWQEGIILTLADLATNCWNNKSIKKGLLSKFGEDVDPYLRKVYKNNLQLLVYDFIMFAVIGSILGALLGDWLEDLKEDNKKNRDFITGLKITAANVCVMSVKNSFLDFNFFTSIGDPFGQWTPFSIEWSSRVIKNWWNVAVGDEDFFDGVVKTFSGLRLIKPLLDSIKPDMFRTEQEGGTFNVE